MQIKSIRIIFVSVVVLLSCGMLYLRFFYFDERGRQASLTESIDCADVLPSDLEIQGARSIVPATQACSLIKSVGKMPTIVVAPEDSTDPWHYFGRLRIKLNRDVWFLVFRARKSEQYRPRFALRHWKGSGWTIIGDFDAEPVLRMLQLSDKIDPKKLESPESLTPTDQSEAM